MGIFELMEEHGHDEVLFCYNKPTQLKAIIAIHNTTLGNAVGGCRLWRYESETEALVDALTLSRIMTYQSAVADSDTGGGKAVLCKDFEEETDEAYFRAFGRFVEGLKGRFITYPDLGTDTQEMKYIKRETKYVLPYESPTGIKAESADLTAHGVYWGMKACVKEIYGISSLDGLTVAIQGVGSVGKRLVDCLKQEKVKLIVTDLNYDSIKDVQDKFPDTEVVRPDEILSVECDILSPCALGPVITQKNISQLKCKIIAGAAYDIVEDVRICKELFEMGIVYAPDFVVNAGELFLTEDALKVLSKEEALDSVKKIYNIMAKVIAISKKEKISPYEAACKMAEERIKRVGAVKSILTHSCFEGRRKP
ncbi:MAG: Glu/Leu/Phe/Val dehydrogenase [candidate division Zixibacteria bacterium]|nr:Glu/Leu/Phe/Val dehydrogenase [candidate division Zixibacteria bacterium]